MQQARKDGPAFALIVKLLSEREMGFNEILRALKRKHLLGSGSTLAQYLQHLEKIGQIKRRVIREKPPRIVEYTLVEDPPKRSEDSFLWLREHVTVSDSVTVTLTDVKTGEKRTLTLGKDGEWLPV